MRWEENIDVCFNNVTSGTGSFHIVLSISESYRCPVCCFVNAFYAKVFSCFVYLCHSMIETGLQSYTHSVYPDARCLKGKKEIEPKIIDSPADQLRCHIRLDQKMK